MENIQILTNYRIQNTVTPVIKFNQKIYRNKTHNKYNGKTYIKNTVFVPKSIYTYFKKPKTLYLLCVNDNCFEIINNEQNKTGLCSIVLNKNNRFVIPKKLVTNKLYCSFVYVPLFDKCYLLL